MAESVVPGAGVIPTGPVTAPEVPVQQSAAHPLHMVTPVAPVAPKAPVPAKEDASRFEYHQRRADLIDKQLKEIQPLAEIGRKVAENPELMALLSGKTAAATVTAPKVTAPIAPSRPADYSDEEAFNDPRSSSFKYRVANEQYRDQMLTFVVTREGEREAQRQAEVQARQQAELVDRNTAAFKAQLMHQYAMSSADADDMIATLADPTSVETANLVELFKVVKQKRAAAAGRGGAAPPISMGPIPPSMLGGETTAPATEEGQFNAAFTRYKTKAAPR
jgi:hypothetical protein